MFEKTFTGMLRQFTNDGKDSAGNGTNQPPFVGRENVWNFYAQDLVIVCAMRKAGNSSLQTARWTRLTPKTRVNDQEGKKHLFETSINGTAIAVKLGIALIARNPDAINT